MSFQYLFGNVDESGKLEADSLDEELRATLTSEETANYLDKVLGGIGIERDKTAGDVVEHSKDAVDYSDIQELADQDALMDDAPSNIPQAYAETTQLKKFDPSKLTEVFPTYGQGRTKFSELFSGKFPKRPLLGKLHTFKRVKRDDYYHVMKNQLEYFHHYQLSARPRPQIQQEKPVVQVETTVKTQDTDFMPILLDAWEDRIIWDTDGCAVQERPLKFFRNTSLEKLDWFDAIIWDEAPVKPVEFHLDDPALAVTNDVLEEALVQREHENTIPYRKRPDGKLIDRLNISDDWLYEDQKKAGRIRQTFGPTTIIHSVPAMKLHSQYYKPMITVKELRSFHRPPFKVNIGEDILFFKVKRSKNLKDLDASDRMKLPKDLTLKDSSKFVLMEYSEEYPAVIQNVGMASLIYNYYRKKDEKDSFVPKHQYGSPYVLESVDASPFFGYGDVEPGQTLPVLYNNLYRAPIQLHEPKSTDFLLIRHTYHGRTKHYLRPLPVTFLTGQTFPVQEVPRPQARKVTQMLKMRLQGASYRLITKDHLQRIRFDKLRKAFPMFNDFQIRFKLKEFAQYYKKGENTGWWKLKPSIQLPDETGIRKFLTPEMICLYESSIVGHQRLKDAGYALDDMKESDNPEELSHADLEVQLAPWITTKNFCIAAAGKGMLQLYGPGDPTGCGEAFSFIRASMKEMFFRQGESEAMKLPFMDPKIKNSYHKYSIAEQQQVYKEEINRIWSNQLNSLVEKQKHEEVEDMEKLLDSKRQLEAEEERERRKEMGYSNPSSPMPFSPPATGDDAVYSDVEQESQAESLLAGKSRMLVINRLVKEGDQLVWKSEVVTDVKVMNAYLRYRKLIEQQDFDPSINYSEEDKRKIIKKRTREQVVKLQRKQGKKVTYGDVEIDVNENLVIQKNNRGGELEPKSMPVILKIPTNVEPAAPPPEPKKKKEEAPAPVSIVLKIEPKVELSSIFQKIISELMNTPEAWPFLQPVNEAFAPNYFSVIQHPKCLSQIRDDVVRHQYTSAQAFLSDIQLVADNCRLYNGPQDQLTAIVDKLVDKARTSLYSNRDTIQKLEQQMNGTVTNMVELIRSKQGGKDEDVIDII